MRVIKAIKRFVAASTAGVSAHFAAIRIHVLAKQGHFFGQPEVDKLSSSGNGPGFGSLGKN
jgi:hypothetical protein